MVSKSLYISIVFRVSLLAVTALVIGWTFFGAGAYFVGIFLILIFTIQCSELIYSLNRTNSKIAFFFDAIRNDDSTLNFPGKTGNKALNELNKSLNKVNELI